MDAKVDLEASIKAKYAIITKISAPAMRFNIFLSSVVRARQPASSKKFTVPPIKDPVRHDMAIFIFPIDIILPTNALKIEPSIPNKNAKDKFGIDVFPRLLLLSLYSEKIDRTKDDCNKIPQLTPLNPDQHENLAQ